MNCTHYFQPNKNVAGFSDFDRPELFEGLDAVAIGKGATPDQIQRVRDELPGLAAVGAYYMCAFELNQKEQDELMAFCQSNRLTPPRMSNRYTGVGRIVGEMNEAFCAWHAERAARMVATADFVISDNSDPRQPIPTRGYVATVEETRNWRVWVPQVMDAINDAIGAAKLVPNVGHGCNPVSVANPELRDCYFKFCNAVAGIGVEKITGNPLATYTPATFIGPYDTAGKGRMHLAFAQDAPAWAATDAMALPAPVVKSCVKHVMVAAAGVA